MVSIIMMLAALAALMVFWTQKITRDAERAVPPVGKIHKVPGGAVHYLDIGPRDAPVLVMIHGLAGTLQHFTYAVAGLLDQEYRLIIVDRPGCGYSEKDDLNESSLSLQAHMIGALLADLQIEKPVLVGHSLGGAVSLMMALEQPDKIGALALVAPLTHEVTQIPALFKGLDIESPRLRWLIGHMIAGPVGKITADHFAKGAFAPETPTADFMDRSGAVLGLRPKGYIVASADLAAVTQETPRPQTRYATELGVPGGVLYGTQDALLSCAEQGAVMTQYGLSYEVLEGRGHMLPFTAAQETADFIRRIAAKVNLSN